MSHKIHILHLISSFSRGGRERQLATIYKFSDKNKFSTKIVCFNRTTNSYIEEYDMSKDFTYLSTRGFLGRFKTIRKIIKENNSNILWTWGGLEATFGIMLSLTTNVKHINGSIRHGIVRFKTHQIWRLIVLHLSRYIVANSHAGLRANKLKRGLVLYNGIDDKFFVKPEKTSNEIRNEFKINSHSILITSVANLIPYKDFFTVLKALSKIKEKGIAFHYLAIGEGKDRNNIEEYVKILNLQADVSFPGNRADIKDILYASDIFVHSSIGEGCSNSILEAMAAGLPVIATDTGGTNEIVDTSNGRLFEFKDVEQLVSFLLELIGNKSLREELAENSKEKALNNFSVERMMEEYFGIIEEVGK